MGTKTPNVGEQTAAFTPDLLIIPSRVAFDKDLQPLDTKVYGVIYWFERLKDGRCWASNTTIGNIVGANATSVSKSISRLADKHYVVLALDEKGQRKSIVCVVNMGLHYTPSSNEQGGVAQMSKQDNKIKKELTSETRADVDKIYRAWLVHFIIGPDRDPDATEDEREALIATASKTYRLTDKRRDKVVARLGDAGLPMILRAIKNISASGFHRGENDREWTATLEWLCNSYEKIEEWSTK